jgi:hypothetical protein
MLRIEPRLAFINGVLLANRTLIFRFQLLAVYVLLVHNCGECRIVMKWIRKPLPTNLDFWLHKFIVIPSNFNDHSVLFYILNLCRNNFETKIEQQH